MSWHLLTEQVVGCYGTSCIAEYAQALELVLVSKATLDTAFIIHFSNNIHCHFQLTLLIIKN